MKMTTTTKGGAQSAVGALLVFVVLLACMSPRLLTATDAAAVDASVLQSCESRDALASGKTHCLCGQDKPVCIGSRCATGTHQRSNMPVSGFRLSCQDCYCTEKQDDVEWLDDDGDHDDGLPKNNNELQQQQQQQQQQNIASDSHIRLIENSQPTYLFEEDEDESGATFRAAQKVALASALTPVYDKLARRLGGDTSLGMQDPRHWDDGVSKPRVLIMTVATHREPFIELTEQSVRAIGKTLHVAGEGEFFKGYGWKLQRMRRTLLDLQDQYEIVFFTDSFDSYVFAEEDEIVETFRRLQAPMVVSAEVNCWPYPYLKDFMPPSSKTGKYPFPNSGGYIGYVGYILHLYNDIIEIQHKSSCCDDQGELIKAVVKDHNAFRIDHNAKFFQTLFGAAQKDVTVRNGRVYNSATATYPIVIHANGWDKGPLLDILQAAGKLTPEYRQTILEQKSQLEKQKILESREDSVNTRCANHNPNPTLDPETNYISEYGLMSLLGMRRKQLEQEGVSWDVIEQQVFEVQEYRTHCPALASYSTTQPFSFDPSIKCSQFKVYVYPLSSEEELRLPIIYQYVRHVIRSSAYYTSNPHEACVFVPATDTSCWCEECMAGTYRGSIEGVHPKSQHVKTNLTRESFWNEGRNHILFEFSDAPCLPWPAGNAIVAKAGLSEFHYRHGMDVSLPLFPMVSYTPEQRRVPAEDRKYLVTFRGTKSPRSDAVRKHLPALHNGEDVILVCACRWFGDQSFGKSENNEACAEAEVLFNKYTYTDLALNTKFGLIVEGFGYHSFRLTEIMAAGAIPVIVVDHYVLPYENVLDWESFSVRIPEHRLYELPSILRALSPAVVHKMQERVVFVFEKFFRSLAYHVYTALESVHISQFAGDNEAYLKRKLQTEGLPIQIHKQFDETDEVVIRESLYCNTPPHRRQASKDNAPM